jgi:hypothetical protein
MTHPAAIKPQWLLEWTDRKQAKHFFAHGPVWVSDPNEAVKFQDQLAARTAVIKGRGEERLRVVPAIAEIRKPGRIGE